MPRPSSASAVRSVTASWSGTDSGARLSDLARANLLLIPLDDRQEWYRYHPPPAGPPPGRAAPSGRASGHALHARAAAWHGSHADDETALEYAMLAGDIDLAARLLPQLAQRAYNSGASGACGAGSRRWTRAVPAPPLRRRRRRRDPVLPTRRPGAGRSLGAIPQRLAARPCAGRPRGGDAQVRASVPVSKRVEQMRADAQAAVAAFAEDDQWRRSRCCASNRRAGSGRRRSGGRHPRNRPFEPRGRAGIAQGDGRRRPRLSRRDRDGP